MFVFANLKPSQIHYKVIPLSQSDLVEHVYILRKTPLTIDGDKITCLSLPWLFRQRPIYWLVTAIYGTYLLKKHKANIILNYNIFPHGFNAFVASKLTGLPSIFSEINEDTINYFQKPLSHLLVTKILKNVKVICVPGKNTELFWNKVGYLNTTRLHSTINTSLFRNDGECEKIYDFIYVGVFDRNKRPDIIIDAFYQIRQRKYDVTLCLIGYGELKELVLERINCFGLANCVTLVETNDVLAYFIKSKVFVMASLSEGLPCAMMEAMATELVVVVPSVGDIDDVVIHGVNGFIHNNSKDDISKWMLEAVKQYESLGEFRKKAREEIVDRHSYGVATCLWNDLFKKIKNS